MDIMTDYEAKGVEITNQVIQEELEKNLKGIEILEDLTGTYKDYEYEIDNKYNVHIIGKTTDIIKLNVNPKLGTTYITINIEASSTKGEINQYNYIIDGTTYSETQATYTIENLEPESKHTIKVIVTDDKQNKKESREIILKTEPRTYLYKEGEEYVELTGGWNVGYLDGNNSSVGNATKYENYIEAQTWGYWCGYGCITQNVIDITEYSKIKIDIFDSNWTDISGGYEQINIKCGSNLVFFYRDDIQDKIYEMDINSLTGENNIQIVIGNGANAKIKSIWLEK